MTKKKLDPLDTIIQIRHPDAVRKKQYPKSPLIWTEAKRDEVYFQVNEERMKKIPFLFKKYDIHGDEPDKWMKLAWGLACDNVTGFQYRWQAGRTGYKSVGEQCRFYRYYLKKRIHLKKERSRTKISNRQICIALEKDKEFKGQFPQYKNVTVSTLQDICTEVLKMRKARIAYCIEYCRLKHSKRLNLDDDEAFYPGIILGNPPPWEYAMPSSKLLSKISD